MLTALIVALLVGVLVLPRAWVVGMILGISVFTPKVGEWDVATLMLPVALLRVSRSIIRDTLRSKFLLSYIALVLWACLSVVWTVNADGALETVRAYIRVAAAMIIAGSCIRKPEDLVPAATGLGVAIVMACTRVYLIAAGYGTPTEMAYAVEFGRIFPGGLNPNLVALEIVWGLALIGYLLKDRVRWRRQRRLVMGALLAVSLPALMLLASRAALVAMVAAPLTAFLLTRRNRTTVVVSLLGFGLVAGILVHSFGAAVRDGIDIPFISEITNQRISAMLNAEDDTHRLEIWKTGMLMAIEHPIVGVGAGNAREYYPDYAPRVWSDPLGGYRRTLHSTFVNLFAELGLIGVALAALVGWFWAGQHGPRPGGATAFSIATVLLVLITGATHNFEQSTFFMVMLTAVHRYRMVSKSQMVPLWRAPVGWSAPASLPRHAS